jgi:hypothetical protein
MPINLQLAVAKTRIIVPTNPPTSPPVPNPTPVTTVFYQGAMPVSGYMIVSAVHDDNAAKGAEQSDFITINSTFANSTQHNMSQTLFRGEILGLANVTSVESVVGDTKAQMIVTCVLFLDQQQ